MDNYIDDKIIEKAISKYMRTSSKTKFQRAKELFKYYKCKPELYVSSRRYDYTLVKYLQLWMYKTMKMDFVVITKKKFKYYKNGKLYKKVRN